MSTHIARGARNRVAVAGLSVFFASSCYDFRVIGPEDAPPQPNPNTVSVSITYERPAGCQNTSSPCTGNIVFFASWMREPNYLILKQTSGHEWAGTATNVPVNYPTGSPYTVYIHDPYLLDVGTCGVTAERLVIGRERITAFRNPGGCSEQGLIRIDAAGYGRTP